MNHDKYINSVNLNQNENFPYLVLNVINGNSYPRNPGFRVMHWHEDIQFIYVLDGKIEEFIKEYDKLSENELLNRRYERFRKF